LGREYIGIEKEAEYVAIAEKRLAAVGAETPLFAALEAAPAD
jgi:DNA modification methylase